MYKNSILYLYRSVGLVIKKYNKNIIIKNKNQFDYDDDYDYDYNK
jgi:hypothetical protein